MLGIAGLSANSNLRMPSEVFIQLVDAHYAPLYRFALSLARREADACDLVQQTFFIWAKRGHQLREDTKAKTWLFTTLYREFLRGRRRDQRVQSIEELPEGAEDVAAEEIDHARRLDGSQIVDALQQVDEVYRAPLVLFYLQDMSYHEIAETLDVPIGTVMSRLSRGKIRLRRLLVQKETATSRLGTVVEFPDLKKGTAGR